MSTKPKFHVTLEARTLFLEIGKDHERGVIKTADFIMLPDRTSIRGYILARRVCALLHPNN